MCALSVYHGGRWGVRATKHSGARLHSLSTSVDGGGCSLSYLGAQGGVFLGGLALQFVLLRTPVREGGTTLLCTQVHEGGVSHCLPRWTEVRMDCLPRWTEVQGRRLPRWTEPAPPDNFVQLVFAKAGRAGGDFRRARDA